MTKRQTGQHSGMLVVGDQPFLLEYDFTSKCWMHHYFSEESAFKGSLKYVSLASFGAQIYITGGCDNLSGVPVNSTYLCDPTNSLTTFTLHSSMTYPRYGHMSTMLGGRLFVCGGFDHEDNEQSMP